MVYTGIKQAKGDKEMNEQQVISIEVMNMSLSEAQMQRLDIIVEQRQIELRGLGMPNSIALAINNLAVLEDITPLQAEALRLRHHTI